LRVRPNISRGMVTNGRTSVQLGRQRSRGTSARAVAPPLPLRPERPMSDARRAAPCSPGQAHHGERAPSRQRKVSSGVLSPDQRPHRTVRVQSTGMASGRRWGGAEGRFSSLASCSSRRSACLQPGCSLRNCSGPRPRYRRPLKHNHSPLLRRPSRAPKGLCRVAQEDVLASQCPDRARQK
jgi:hypothetical protein